MVPWSGSDLKVAGNLEGDRIMILLMIIVWMVAFPLTPLGANELPLRTFAYHEGFEGNTVPLKMTRWGPKVDYTINFQGITEERAYTGKKSYKLDITFHNEGGLFFELPALGIPAEGTLRLTARIFVARQSSVAGGWSFRVAFPPTAVSVLKTFDLSWPTDPKWKQVDLDLVNFAATKAAQHVPRQFSGASTDSVGAVAQNFVFSVYGHPGALRQGHSGERVIVYFDDIRIEGETPDRAEYRQDITHRWQPVIDRMQAKIAAWQDVCNDLDKEAAGLSDLSVTEERLKTAILDAVVSTRRAAAQVMRDSILPSSRVKQITKTLKHSYFNLRNIRTLQQRQGETAGYLVYVVQPTADNRILPYTAVVPGLISDTLELTACPGEYEPASFVIRSMKDLRSLIISAGDLKYQNSSIPSANVDIKIVKVWHRAGKAWESTGMDRSMRFLSPELLVNDDGLVKTDFENKEDFLKVSFPEGARYLSMMNEKGFPGIPNFPTVKEFPVKDSPTMLPFDVPGNTNKQIWITVKVPAEAPPGEYQGKLVITHAAGPPRNLDLRVQVLPIHLAPPAVMYSIYNELSLDPSGAGRVAARWQNEQQYRASIENLVAHGVTNPLMTQALFGQASEKEHDHVVLFSRALAIRQAAGIRSPIMYYTVGDLGYETERLDDEKQVAAWIGRIRRAMAFLKARGIDELYLYGSDEAGGEIEGWRELQALREPYRMMKEAGAKVFAATHPGAFDLIGDIQDMTVYPGYPNPQEARTWHNGGRVIFSYANPQAGVTNPEVYRRNFGLLIWKNGFDGAMPFTYQCPFGNIWNDYDSPDHRNHGLTYPTVDGVIDTVPWEGFREAVDDVRYVTTLLQEIEKGAGSSDKTKVKAAVVAKAFLDSLDLDADLDEVRAHVIEHILALTGG